MHLKGTPERVFPLLCPVREYEWIETWQGRLVYSDSGVAEDNCIFKTDLPGQGEDVWVVSRYEPCRAIEFVRFGGERVMRYNIALRSAGGDSTEARWTQILTGLSEAGNRHVEGYANRAFHERMADLEHMLNHYLTTGQMLRAGDGQERDPK